MLTLSRSRVMFIWAALASSFFTMGKPLHAADGSDGPALEVVAKLDGPLVTGITVSRRGRVFVSYPRWSDPISYSVAEILDGKPNAFPDEAAFAESLPPKDRLISIQSVVIDSQDRLWALDSGSVNQGPIVDNGPKLVAYDITSRTVVEKIALPEQVAHRDSYLNDVRFDLRRGKGGYAFITDSSSRGLNAIIVVDLASGESWRRLDGHRSVRSQAGFLPRVNGTPLMVREPGQRAHPLAVGCDGIALNADGSLLYYSPLTGNHLYSVSVDALIDRKKSDPDVARTIVDLGNKTTASDGMAMDAKGRLYLASYEHNAVLRRNPDGSIDTIVQDPRLQWPDTLAISRDHYLYVTANQLNLLPRFHDGKDLRHQPWYIFRVQIDAGPVSR
ncbi:MAG TPA: L-dopachrome tautomerase-related protein [Opitutaceae bacterium]